VRGCVPRILRQTEDYSLGNLNGLCESLKQPSPFEVSFEISSAVLPAILRSTTYAARVHRGRLQSFRLYVVAKTTKREHEVARVRAV